MTMNIGMSARLGYDDDAFKDKVKESVSPMNYKLEPLQYTNNSSCLSTLGPRSDYKAVGVSTVCDCRTLPAADLTDFESVLSNRNIPLSKTSSGNTNMMDIKSIKLNHINECNTFLNSEPSMLTYPPRTFRGMSINRFYDLPRNPQSVIYWSDATNTSLEAKDNFKTKIPKVQNYDPAMPREIKGTYNPTNCMYKCGAYCDGSQISSQISN